MKKTLIALTLAALPVASMADVVLYGQIKGGVEVGFYDKVAGQKSKDTTTAIVDYGSRIGFKGHEHLNGDLKAIWQLEQKVDIAGGGTGSNKGSKGGINGFGTRDSFIGLQSDSIGTVKAGYFQSPVAVANGRLDDWEYSSDYLGLGTFTRGTDAAKRAVAVAYTTPNLGGFSATAYASPSDNNAAARDAASPAKAGRDAAMYGLGATYENNGFFADVAGGYVKGGANNGTLNANPAVKEKKGYQVVSNVGYEAGKLLAGVGYQRAVHVDEDYDVANEVAATVAYEVAPNLRLKGTAAHGFRISDAGGAKLNGNGKYYQGIIGADYALSKRTTVNGQVGYYESGKNTNTSSKVQTGVAGVGIKHKF